MASRAVTPRKAAVRKSDAEWRAGLRRGLRRLAQMTGAGLLLGACVFLALALLSYTQTDPSPSTAADPGEVANWMGTAGAWVADRVLLVLGRFEDFDGALVEVNDSRFGLQAGVFTDSVAHMHRAWDRLRVGGVIINDVPSFRVDHMPYGGVKDSGLGREGVRSAIEDMTEVRLMVVRDQQRN